MNILRAAEISFVTGINDPDGIVINANLDFCQDNKPYLALFHLKAV